MWYKCQCDCGNICEVSGNSLKENHTTSCGCMTSKGETIIANLLKQQKVIFNQEVILPQFVQEENRKLRFDFVIYDQDGSINRIIEFDGRQHKYGPDTNYWGHSTDTLADIQKRDVLKNNFCLRHNYKLIRIPYTKIENITVEDLFSDKYLITGGDFCGND